MTRSTTHTTLPRLYVEAPLARGLEVIATSAQAHHLGTVLRRGVGDAARLFNGLDGEWIARLGTLRRDRAAFSVEDPIAPQTPEGGPWLMFALLKRDAIDLVVRQAVELGAARLLPVITARTNAARVNPDRLHAIAIEAAEQCERLTVPPIDPPRPLNDALAAWPPDRRLFAALERSETGAPVPGQAGLLIGPEGGFTPDERRALQRLPFVTPISLGRLILRAETAAVAGLARLAGLDR